MSTKFSINDKNRYADTGYEGNNQSNYVIPSCGIEDLDKSVFNLFDKELPLYYTKKGVSQRVPVIFASGERFALIKRKKPLTDDSGALILPLISITRNSIENIPPKGVANNQMYPHLLVKKISGDNTEYSQLTNKENLNNTNFNSSFEKPNVSLKYKTKDIIYETIEIPAPKYFATTYEISIWSSYTKQMNHFIEAIMSAYTLNPGQQFKLQTDKGYWFSAFVDSSFTQDSNYADFSDAERYIKYNMTINATGYIIAPNIEGEKVSLRSFKSITDVNFEAFSYENNEDISDTLPNIGGISSNNVNAKIFNELETSETYNASQMIGINTFDNVNQLNKNNKSKGYATSLNKEELNFPVIGNFSTKDFRTKKTYIIDDETNEKIPVKAINTGKGELVYNEDLAKKIFDI